MADREFLARLGEMFSQAIYPLQESPDSAALRRIIMNRQMREAQDIADSVRGRNVQPPNFEWAPRPLPELPTEYQPPERFNYGPPVRLG